MISVSSVSKPTSSQVKSPRSPTGKKTVKKEIPFYVLMAAFLHTFAKRLFTKVFEVCLLRFPTIKKGKRLRARFNVEAKIRNARARSTDQVKSTDQAKKQGNGRGPDRRTKQNGGKRLRARFTDKAKRDVPRRRGEGGWS